MRSVGNILIVLGVALASAMAPKVGTAGVTSDRAGDGGEQTNSPAATARIRAGTAYYRKLAAALAQENQPRSLAFAALLQTLGSSSDEAAASRPAPSAGASDSRALAWLKAADAGAGDDVLADLLIAQTATETKQPSIRSAAARRWAEAEPDNLAPLFSAGDSPQTLLAAVHARPRFNLRWLDQIRWMSAAIGRYPDFIDPTELVHDGVRVDVTDVTDAMAIAMTSAFTIPAFQGIVDACKGKALAAATSRRIDCVALGQALRKTSDILVAQMIGNTIVKNASADAATREDAIRFERTLRWQLEQNGKLAGGDANKTMARFHRNLHDPMVRTEQQAIERDLTDARIALVPPAGWNPTTH